MNTQKTIPIIIVAIIIIAGVWYFMSIDTSTKPNENVSFNNGQTNAEGAVAVVNGEEISRAQFEALKSQIMAQQGFDKVSLNEETKDQLETQIVNDLVFQTLLQQAVIASEITASQADIDAQIEATVTQLGGEEAFNEALTAEGVSVEDFRAQINNELAVQAYLEQELNLSSITATNEEIEAAYAQASAQDENVPPLEDVRLQVEQLVIQQKQQPLLDQLAEKLRTDANIEILL